MTIDVGSDRQFFLDDLFFESRSGIELKMHKPRAEEVIFQRDKPWETRSLDTPCIVRDSDLYRMWYRADQGSRSERRERAALGSVTRKARTASTGTSPTSVSSNTKDPQPTISYFRQKASVVSPSKTRLS